MKKEIKGKLLAGESRNSMLVSFKLRSEINKIHPFSLIVLNIVFNME